MSVLGQMPKGPQPKEKSLQELAKFCSAEVLEILVRLAKKPGATKKLTENIDLIMSML